MTARYITVYRVIMGLSNAERQRRFRERRKEQLPRIHYRWPQRWRDALQTLVDLRAEYQDWLDNLPDGLQATPLAERLEAICEHGFSDLESLESSLGYGRD